ncbi:cyclic-guanylate-specific phosphodiesterase [Maritalea myrionectae]|uniref:Cyclic-guanylate-specific phosphodiesterase n=1 Tax=Maritalea myrionectae TaxID=454601 RepID=A0A2R4MF19_9HYPH|nr:GGDEF domain-containing protein [Maritalea myrionectae]AVX04600.1 cyclic-guanylate-specific phosphodiesterase [Maritalea myrionectae]
MNKRHPSRIVFSIGGIFAAFVLLVIAFVISSLFVLNVSGNAANDLKLAAEKRAALNMIESEISDVAQRQSEVSWWDTTIVALSEGFDRVFFADAMLGWFPIEYGIDRSMLVSPDSKMLLHAKGELFTMRGEGEAFFAQVQDLVTHAQDKYMERRIEEAGAYRIEGDPVRDDPVLYAHDIRKIDGEIGIVIAQAIIPDGVMVLLDETPHVLVTFRPFTAQRIAEYGREIELKEFRVSLQPPASEMHLVTINSGYANKNVFISWNSVPPSNGIWARSLPALGAMLFVITLVMLGVTIAYARQVYRTRKAEARNRYLAEHDGLTQLPNRNRFDKALQTKIGEDHLGTCAVLCIDLDRFKPVNDTYGHHAGDEVLRTVARRIEEVIGDRGIVARLGGDEFIALLDDAADKDGIMMLCDSVIERISDKICFEDLELYVGASVGVAWWPDDAQTADMVIRSADQALYRAKELGRGRSMRADLMNKDAADDLVKIS